MTRKRLYILALSCVLVFGVCLLFGFRIVLSQPRFGRLPDAARRKGFEASPQYSNGEFHYPIPTPLFTNNAGMLSIMWKTFTKRSERLRPEKAIPTQKTELKALKQDEDTVVWLGHSSWFIQFGGKRILIDPVFSNYAAPFSSMNKAFAGTTIYSADEMPEIDALLISHDHWDHLDYATIITLKPKLKQVICPLGLGASFTYWEFPEERIHEGDWYDTVALDENVTVHLLPARHYSGRSLKKNQTLCAGFALETPQRSLFFSGDSGYGPHFAEIAKRFRGFDLAMLDCGQYDAQWGHIHMTPEEAVQAACDLKAKNLIPAHVGRFAIANHSWDDPYKRLKTASQDKPFQLLTPKIGEPVALDHAPMGFSRWWEQDDIRTETEGGTKMSHNAESEKNETMTVKVEANGKTTIFKLNNSTAAKELYTQLPLNIKVENFSNNEKIFYPPKKLNTNNTPQANARPGTLAYYAPWGNVVMFYGKFGSAPGLFELGHATAGDKNIEDMSGTIKIGKENNEE